MKFQQYYSSSTGNLYVVEANNGRRLMLECGVRWPVLLNTLEYELDSIDACLLTHEHADHSKAVREVMRAGIDVYSSAGTFEALGVIEERRANAIKSSIYYKVSKTFLVYPFNIIHDATEPLGYIVHDKINGDWLLFVPDSGFIKQRFNVKFSIIAIECSYDINILKNRVDTSDINEALAKRIVENHTSKSTVLKYLEDYIEDDDGKMVKICDISKCREIHLLHMSTDNIDKQATKFEFQKRFFIDTFV